MYRELKWLIRRCYRQRLIASQENFIKLEIQQSQKKILLVFYQKPPLEIRKDIRLLNFRWSRKCHYWHAYLNKGRVGKIKQIYKRIYKQNNN